MDKKTCTKCGRSLAVERFSRNRRKSDGLQSQCKNCNADYARAHSHRIRKRVAAWQAANPDRVSEYKSRYRDSHRDDLRAKNETYREEHREEIRAKGRAYQAAKTPARRQMAREYLGGVCASCGSAERLEFDHIDPKTMAFRIGQNLSRAWDVLVPELDKCQLLCYPCHRAKTIAEVKARKRCRGCGCGYDERTPGCENCRKRREVRRRKSGERT